MTKYSPENGSDQPNNTKGLDPIEWAIIAVILGGCSLLLTLEQKIGARRKSEAAETERKAIYGNRLRLRAIRTHLGELQSFLSHIERVGKIETTDIEPGITRGSIVFHSDESQEAFNFHFDEAVYAISRLNRVVSEMDLQGFPFTQEDVDRFVKEPLKQIKDLTWRAINPNTEPGERISLLKNLLEQYGNFLASMEAVLGNE